MLPAYKRMILYFRARPDRAAELLLGQSLLPVQRILLFAAWLFPFVFIVISRGGGKTYILALATTLRAMLYSRQRIGIVAASYRQCLVRDSLVNTVKGLVSLEELSDTPFEDKDVDIPTDVMEGNGLGEIKRLWKAYKTKTKKLVFDLGVNFEGAIGHRVWDGFQYKYIESVKIGEWFPLYLNGSFSKTNYKFKYLNENQGDDKILHKMSPMLAEYLGYLMGNTVVYKKNSIYFITQHEELKERFIKISEELFGLDVKIRYKKNGLIHLSVFSKMLVKFLGYCGVKGKYKKIPLCVRRSSKQCIASFLNALFVIGGCVYYKKVGMHGITFVSTSEVLVRQVQILLFNFGILSSYYKSNDKKRALYQLSIKEFVLFNKEIGISLKCKQRKLEDIINDVKKGKRVIPQSYLPDLNKWLLRKVRNDLIERKVNIMSLRFWEHLGLNTKGFVKRVLGFCDKYNVVTENVVELQNYYKSVKNIHWIQVRSIEDSVAITQDIAVPGYENYKANGFIHHNSKMTFAEIRRMYQQSKILQDCCIKPPVVGTDSCYLLFKNGSEIDALPLGDGSKIRGARYFFLVLDERAQIPKDIIDKVIIGMTATVQDPVFNTKRQKIIEKYGVDIAKYREEAMQNHILSASTAFYQFNHLWESITTIAKTIQTKKVVEDKEVYKMYALVKASYDMFPKGFMNMATIEHARETMSELEFGMEYKGVFPPESGGFFSPQIVLNAVSLTKDAKILAKGREGRQYILFIDPARTHANCAYVLLEINNGVGYHLIPYIATLNNAKFQTMTLKIWELLKSFNIIRIAMDAGGGGREIKDLLTSKELCPSDCDLIYDFEDPLSYEDERQLIPKEGKHILHMIDFTSKYLYESNHALLSGFERRDLLFPRPLDSDDLKVSQSEADALEQIEYDIQQAKREILCIIVTTTPKGYPTWLPAKKKQRVDRYDGVLGAYYEVRQMQIELPKKGGDLPIGGWIGDPTFTPAGTVYNESASLVSEETEEGVVALETDKNVKKSSIYDEIALN